MSSRCSEFAGATPFTVAIDVLAVNLGYLLAYIVAPHFGQLSPGNVSALLLLALIVSSVSIVVLALLDLYGDWVQKQQGVVLRCVVSAGLFIDLCTMAVAAWSLPHALPRPVIVIAFPLVTTLLLCDRLLLISVYRARRADRRLLVIGQSASQLNKLTTEAWPYSARYNTHGTMINPTLIELRSELNKVDAVIVTHEMRNRVQLIDTCVRSGKEVFLVPGNADLLLSNAQVQQMNDLLVFRIRSPELPAVTAVLKRCVDILLSATILVAAAPILFAVWLAVRSTSRGPGFYRQKRIGWRGKPFALLKFRTMIAGAERSTGPVLAIDGDPRITGLGRILRATHLDELPQLFNVLCGEMSLVGPRPERPNFTSEYERTVPNYSVRYVVRPGITGLAQVRAGYDTPAECKLRFDLMYVYSYSLLLDLKILLQTFATLLPAWPRSTAVEANRAASCIPGSLKSNGSEADFGDKLAA